MTYFGKRDALIFKRKTSLKSQNKVAAEIGISQSLYSQIENGYSNPSPEIARKISEMFELGDSYFQNEKGE